MSVPGDSLKRIFENKLLHLKGTELTIYKNWGKEEMTSVTSKGIKESATKFEFPIETEIEKNDVIQINGSRSFWKAVDVDEDIKYGVPRNLAVHVVKIDHLGNEISLNAQGKAVFHGATHGNVQIGGQNNTQNLTINNISNSSFDEAINALSKLIGNSSLDELDKEDYLAELERIKQLAQKEQTPQVAERAKSKLLSLDTALRATDIALKAGPLITQLLAVFGG